jgi:hypothetical protein
MGYVNNPCKCVEEGLNIIRYNNMLNFKAVILGERTSNKDDLYALWLFLKNAMERGLNSLKVIRESILILE